MKEIRRQLTDEELKDVDGGYQFRSGSAGTNNHIYYLFTADEVRIIKEYTGIQLRARSIYTYHLLNQLLGLPDDGVFELNEFLLKMGIKRD